jgi:catechol 2,3-dioxygenase-like lactoylglutathione lyase family enzyme
MAVKGVLETCLYADDLDAMDRFYTRVIGLEHESHAEGRHVFFRCGQQMFLVFRPESTLESDTVPPHGAHGPGHVAFAVGADEIAGWRRRLAEHGVEIESDKEWPNGARSLYFRDPAGNSVELAQPALWGLET